jgi:hypothetical protein
MDFTEDARERHRPWRILVGFLHRLIGEQRCLQRMNICPASLISLTDWSRLSPCDMWYGRIRCLRCTRSHNFSTGACILYGISRVVIGENKTFLGGVQSKPFSSSSALDIEC